MRLFIDPPAALEVFEKELVLVISASRHGPPEVFIKEGLAQPDRHFLLGVVQAVAVAVEEADTEFTAFVDADSLTLESSGFARALPNGLIIVRSEDGSLGGLAVTDTGVARRLAREAVRWFTGSIRLDIP